MNKKFLKEKGLWIMETLTKDCMGKLNKARETYSFRSVWANDGKIFMKDEENPSSKPFVYYN